MSARALFVAIVAFVLLAIVPFARDAVGFPVFYLVFLSTIWFWTAQATSWNVLSGFSGYFSFGQAAFVGVGAYTTAVLVGRQGYDFFLTLPVAAVLSTALALGVGALAFRLRSLRGEIFALLTLAVPFILASLARVVPAIDGGQGIIVPAPDVPEVLGGFQEMLYLVGLVIAFGALLTAYVMQHSRTGWALFAIHDAEDVAESLGVPTFRYKMLAIAVTGLVGGLGGSVYALQIGFVTVESVFNLTIPLFVIVMSVLGGRSHWLGPLIGAIVVVTLQDRLASAGFEGWSLVIMGAVLALLVIVAPIGLVARLRPRLPAIGLAVLAAVVLALAGVGGGLIDSLAIALILVAVVALVPDPRRFGWWPARSVESAEEVAAAAPVAALDGAVDNAVIVPEEAATLPDRPLSGAALEAAVAAPIVAADARPVAPPADAPAVLEVTDVAKLFGGVHALDGVSLTVREGELVGLVGPNGSGKSTLIGLLSSVMRPTRGSIRVLGRPIDGIPSHTVVHLGIARTYQIPRPFESMTVRDNIAMAIMFGRDGADLSKARERAEEHLAFVGLERRADSRPAAINLHERQLLEMARALATKPRVLLLDEALAGLNPAEIDQAVGVVRRIHASGVTIVIVEHLLRVVNQLATRIVVLDQGRLLAEGEPSAVMGDPGVVHAYLGRQAGA